MRHTALALGLVCVSVAASAAPPITEPVDVIENNPVLPVEVQNGDPIPVSNTKPRLDAIEVGTLPASGARRNVGLQGAGAEPDARPYLEHLPD